MAYTRTHWTNNLTQLNAKNMNNIEDGIEENTEHISQSDAEITGLKTRIHQAETDIEDASDAITAEASARQAADTTLQSNITSEATTRQNTDTQLQGQITSNYNELDGKVQVLDSRVTALENTDTQLQGQITSNYNELDGKVQVLDSRVTALENTDTQLQGQITANYNELDGREEALNMRVTALEAIHTTYSDPNSDGNIVITSTDV